MHGIPGAVATRVRTDPMIALISYLSQVASSDIGFVVLLFPTSPLK
jgi:hypothetical protein